eukprot:5580634-Amphidinium_carterae.1
MAEARENLLELPERWCAKHQQTISYIRDKGSTKALQRVWPPDSLTTQAIAASCRAAGRYSPLLSQDIKFLLV